QINADGTGLLDRVNSIFLQIDDPNTGLDALAGELGTLTITVGTKPKIFYQADKPSLTGRIDGDLWIESDNKNKQWVYSATVSDFVHATDADKVRVYAQATKPGATGRLAGD